jgi:hypothetical protein
VYSINYELLKRFVMKKFVAVLDRNYGAPFLLNALGHLSIGMGDMLKDSGVEYSEFQDTNGKSVSYLTDYPLIILGAKSGEKIKTIYEKAELEGVKINVYYDIMFSGSVSEQLENTKSKSYDKQKFVGILLFGEVEVLNVLTKRISLLK